MTTDRKKSTDRDMQIWLQHCEESGNWRGAAEALEECQRRRIDPLPHQGRSYAYRPTYGGYDD